MNSELTNQLVGIAIKELPSLIGFVRTQFANSNPDAAEPTSEEVIAAFQSACASSLAKDEAWLAAHPPTP